MANCVLNAAENGDKRMRAVGILRRFSLIAQFSFDSNK